MGVASIVIEPFVHPRSAEENGENKMRRVRLDRTISFAVQAGGLEKWVEFLNNGSVKAACRKGFTIVEMLVLVGIFLVLVSIFVPYVMSLRESRNRIACADNLRQINQALRGYVEENGRSYPRVVYDAERMPNGWTAFSGPDCDDPFLDGATVKPNDVTASLWLLVRTQHLDTAAFVCPSTSDRRDLMTNDQGVKVDVEKRGNFRSPTNLSYSYAQPFSAALGYRNDDSRRSDFALLADRNPGRANGYDVTAVKATDSPLALAKGNSRNHRGAGQNVLYASGAVEFVMTPFAGAWKDTTAKRSGDNIYTALRESPLEAGSAPPADEPGYLREGIGPAWSDDSLLVPFEK